MNKQKQIHAKVEQWLSHSNPLSCSVEIAPFMGVIGMGLEDVIFVDSDTNIPYHMLAVKMISEANFAPRLLLKVRRAIEVEREDKVKNILD